VKKLILLLLLSPLAAAQIPARYDLPTVTTTSNLSAGSLPNVLAVTNANVSVCGFPAAITAGVCTNKIITIPTPL